MDVAFYREQEQRCRRLAEAAEDPEVKAALFALADENVAMAEKFAALSSKSRQPRA